MTAQPVRKKTLEPHEAKLAQLRYRLNQIYRVQLARPANDDWRVDLTVCRGQSIDDVIVGIRCDPETLLFDLTAWTCVAWSSNSHPFQRTERDVILRATEWVLRYIPDTPAT